MSDSAYNRIIDNFAAEDMQQVLRDSLPHSEIVNFARKCGLSYNGRRIKSMPINKLINDLAEDFFAEGKNVDSVIRTLNKHNIGFINKIKSMHPNKTQDYIEKNLKDLKQNKQIGNIMWAIMTDERKAVNQLIGILKSGLNGGNHGNVITREEKTKPSPQKSDNSDNPDLAKEIRKLKDEISHLEKSNKKQNSKYEELEKKYNGLKARIKKLTAERNELKHQKGDMEKEAHIYQTKIRKLENSLKKYSKDEFERLNSEIHHLERENRKLEHELEKLRTQVFEKSSHSVSLLEALHQEITTIKNEIKLHHDNSTEHNEKMFKVLSEVRTDSVYLKKNLEKLRDSRLGYEKRIADDSTRVAVFVDVQNMFYAAKKQYNARLDYEKLLDAAVGNRRLIGAISYIVQTPEVDQSNFVAMLHHKNYTVRTKDLRQRADGSAKGDWDMGMAIDMISVADKVDVIVLVSGDGDFVSLVNLIKAKGPRVEVFGFPHNTSIDLKEAADEFFPIGESLLLKYEGNNHYSYHRNGESVQDATSEVN